MPSVSHALERDYLYTGAPIDDRDPDECDKNGNTYYYDSCELCYRCFDRVCCKRFPLKHKEEIDVNSIPASTNNRYYNECTVCWNPVVYSGYFHFRYKEGYPFLIRQIDYSKKYPQNQAYWPETSYRAEEISDVAVILFEDLVDSTALKEFKRRADLSNHFITDSWYFGRLGYTLSRSLSATCFRFSDFYQVCKDLVQFSEANFTEEECAHIVDKTDVILDKLCGMFLEMYEESIALHPTEEIQGEKDFIDLLYNTDKDIKVNKVKKDFSYHNSFVREAKIKFCDNSFRIKSLPLKTVALPDWLISDYWLYEGVRYVDLFLHSEAISYLTAAIQKDPANLEAYQERLHAHFEMGNLDLAIADYNKLRQLEAQKKELLFDHFGSVVKSDSDQIDYIVNSNPKRMIDYSGGFCVGISNGGGVAVVEFVPSTFSCCKGILHGLWSFACSPVDVSKDLINASYELVEFIKDNTARECLEMVVPELKELCINWDTLSDYERGNKTGYIIGKYGVDILAPGAALKGIKKYRQLKRINSMFTVECCVASEANKAKIIEASTKHASIRSTLTESVKKGKIVSQNPNVAAHILQKKHAWERVIKLTGDPKEDFTHIVKFLEANKILKGKRSHIGQFPLGSKSPKINRYLYEINVNSHVIEAEFIEYIESKDFYLNDAWVKTRS